MGIVARAIMQPTRCISLDQKEDSHLPHHDIFR